MLSFFASCGASLVVTVLVIIYAATGLARDSGFPGGFIRDSDSGELVPVSQINLPTREGAMIVNLLLIILGVLVNIKKIFKIQIFNWDKAMSIFKIIQYFCYSFKILDSCQK